MRQKQRQRWTLEWFGYDRRMSRTMSEAETCIRRRGKQSNQSLSGLMNEVHVVGLVQLTLPSKRNGNCRVD